jgi:hypothetical protein
MSRRGGKLWRYIHSSQASDYIRELGEEVYSTSYKFRASIASAVTAEFGIDCVRRHLVIDRTNIENAVQDCIGSIVGRRVSRFEENAQFCLAIIQHRGIIVTRPMLACPKTNSRMPVLPGTSWRPTTNWLQN